MTRTIDLPAAGMLALGHEAVAILREALVREIGPDGAGYLQQAGYASGDAVYAAFTSWLAAEGHPAPESLDVPSFATLSSEFFAELGWGSFTFGSASPVASIDSTDWIEASGVEGMEQPCCHVGTGLLAAFFGRVADQPLAVMEVECRASGASQCRFLLGGPDIMQEVWERLARGEAYAEPS